MKQWMLERNRYFDSVFLMRISSELEKLDGIAQAVVAMATPVNVGNLMASGYDLKREGALQPADLIIAIDAASDEAYAAAQETLDRLLAGGTDAGPGNATTGPLASTLAEALTIDPEANLALISVPGLHAAREARLALRHGLHVMLFSDNVSIEDEVALKDEAVERGLLMMGPDCGTAILNGAALGFANVCRRGTIGIVGASGTGIQEISSLIHQWGGGLSQAIGTGGRDLSKAVDGRMTRFGIRALGDDPETEVIVVVSKTPSPSVAEKVLTTLEATDKPGVVHFIGARATRYSEAVDITASLADAARAALDKAGIRTDDAPKHVDASLKTVGPAGNPDPGTGRAIGFFCGGTLCQETWSILHAAGHDVASNVAGLPDVKVHAETQVAGHVMWDLGDDVFTMGKPHPMIEPSLRDDRIAAAGEDPTVRLVLADCVIGYGAHENPSGSLASAARTALAAARSDGRELIIIASVTGTDLDPQDLRRQRAILKEAGVYVEASNAEAARLASELLKGGGA